VASPAWRRPRPRLRKKPWTRSWVTSTAKNWRFQKCTPSSSTTRPITSADAPSAWWPASPPGSGGRKVSGRARKPSTPATSCSTRAGRRAVVSGPGDEVSDLFEGHLHLPPAREVGGPGQVGVDEDLASGQLPRFGGRLTNFIFHFMARGVGTHFS